MGPPLKRTHVKGGSAPLRSVDAPGAAGKELGTGDLAAGLKGFFDGLLVVEKVSHSESRACSSSITTAEDLRLLSS
jgi:hypothetical protein